MHFRTEITPQPLPFNLSHQAPTLLLGSCFAQHIGKLLIKYKFDCKSTPMSIAFNPSSILTQLEYAIEMKQFNQMNIVQSHESYVHYDYHSSFSSSSKRKLISKIEDSINITHKQLIKSQVLIITFGTAWCYRLTENNQLVNNCHKLSAKNFRKELLTVKELFEKASTVFKSIFEINPSLNIILTVSPVRHWKDGHFENQVSKGRLLDLCFQLTQTFDQVSYFPAYEIMMDDLRDYRFYDDDLLHPNSLAVNYIWKRFASTIFDSKTMEIISKINNIQLAAGHRPFSPNSTAHQKFIRKQLEIISELENSYFISLTEERQFFVNQLSPKNI